MGVVTESWAERDLRAEARLVVHAAATSRSFKAAAKVIRGAVNDVYDRSALFYLEATKIEAQAKGMTPAAHRAACVDLLLLSAAEAAVAHARSR